MNPPRAVGAACGTGGHCDSFARCVACVTAADCQTAGNPCESPTCVNGTCM